MTTGASGSPTTFDAASLSAGVADLSRFGNIRYFDSLESTNASALTLLDDEAMRGASIIADEQTAGRGRAGRAWTAPRGSALLITTLLPNDLPPSSLPAVGYWLSLCAADAITEACSVWTTLKWPNDLMIGPLKVAGVLIEGRTTGTFTRAVAGIGINVNRPDTPPAELDGIAAWLSDVAGSTIDRTTVAIALLHAYERRYDDLLARPLFIIHEWARRAAIAGRPLRVNSADGTLLHEGVARGLSDDGALLLETKDGPVAVRLGDVSALQL